MIVVGVAPVPSSVNNYSYERFGPNLGVVFFTNTASNNGFTTVLYSSPTKGTYVTTLDSGLGSQHGSVTVAPTPTTTLAPSYLSGTTLHNVITTGTAPFAAKGTSTMILAASTYTLTQPSPVASLTGDYTYEVLTPTIGYISFDDSSAGHCFAVLNFTSATKASYALENHATGGWHAARRASRQRRISPCRNL